MLQIKENICNKICWFTWFTTNFIFARNCQFNSCGTDLWISGGKISASPFSFLHYKRKHKWEKLRKQGRKAPLEEKSCFFTEKKALHFYCISVKNKARYTFLKRCVKSTMDILQCCGTSKIWVVWVQIVGLQNKDVLSQIKMETRLHIL